MRYKSTILSVFIIALIMGCGNESKCGNDAATGHFKDLNGLDGCGMIIAQTPKTVVVFNNYKRIKLVSVAP